jgi:hypothetical protein
MADLARSHFRLAWLGLVVFVALGVGLDVLHAFKLGPYLDAGNEVRRLMWTLAHAHGLGLSLLQLGFAATLQLHFTAPAPGLSTASRALTWATVLMPLGFFLGGLFPRSSDPGPAIALVPLAGALLLLAVVLTTRAVLRARP